MRTKQTLFPKASPPTLQPIDINIYIFIYIFYLYHTLLTYTHFCNICLCFFQISFNVVIPNIFSYVFRIISQNFFSSVSLSIPESLLVWFYLFYIEGRRGGFYGEQGDFAKAISRLIILEIFYLSFICRFRISVLKFIFSSSRSFNFSSSSILSLIYSY